MTTESNTLFLLSHFVPASHETSTCLCSIQINLHVDTMSCLFILVRMKFATLRGRLKGDFNGTILNPLSPALRKGW